MVNQFAFLNWGPGKEIHRQWMDGLISCSEAMSKYVYEGGTITAAVSVFLKQKVSDPRLAYLCIKTCEAIEWVPPPSWINDGKWI